MAPPHARPPPVNERFRVLLRHKGGCVAVLSDQLAQISDLRSGIFDAQPQANSDCHSVRAAQRSTL